MAARRQPLPTYERWLAFLAMGCFLASHVVAGCGPSISKVNGRPDQYYGDVLRLHGRIGEIVVSNETGEARVFHLVSEHGHRIIVIPALPVACRVGDRVDIRGEFAYESAVAGQTYYDVVSAATIRKSGLRRWIPFM